jgi:hypothetical protein
LKLTPYVHFITSRGGVLEAGLAKQGRGKGGPRFEPGCPRKFPTEETWQEFCKISAGPGAAHKAKVAKPDIFCHMVEYGWLKVYLIVIPGWQMVVHDQKRQIPASYWQ